MLDELDGFDPDVEHEGDPVALAAKRIEGATFPKLIIGSTPKLKGSSLIEPRAAAAELQFEYRIPCPSCESEHPLTWGGKDAANGMKWQGREPASIRQLCPACGVLYAQAEYLAVWERGRWTARDGTWIDEEGGFVTADGTKRLPPRSVSFHVWTAYSPQLDWPEIAVEWFAAVDKLKAGDRGLLKSFTNLTLGQPYEAPADKLDEHELKQRADDYPLGVAQAGVLVLVAGIDVQDDRFEIGVWGYGRGCESWLVDYHVIEADPANEADWLKLDDYLLQPVPHANGAKVTIAAAAVDTGGHFTHQAYNYCRARARRRIFAIKGDSLPGRPIKGKGTPQDVNFRDRVIKNGVKLYFCGSDTAKDLIAGRMRLKQPGPGYVHLTKQLPDAFFEQLTAEQRVLRKTARGLVHAWVQTRPRNESLDTLVL